jgi:outer membrane protein assembly factor BamB
MSRGTRLQRWLSWLAGLGSTFLLAAAAWAITQEENISNPNVEFHDQPERPPPVDQQERTNKKGLEPSFEWPVYGYDKARTREFRLKDPSSLHPPYFWEWSERGSVLLEFPPVAGRRSLYLLKNNGALYAMHRKTGRVQWKRKLGSLAAASPGYAHNTVYAVVLERFKGAGGGRIVALDAKDGRTRWSRKLPSRSESSPLVDHGRVYFGSEDGTVYSLDAGDGRVVWRYDAGGAVKAALAMDVDRNLYFGAYGGSVHSIKARDGSRNWKSQAGGNIYSTPAVAYNRVYLGSTDGNVYSFGAATGRLAWRHGTGSYVYGSPAVAKVPDGKPTVYIGSYDSKLYALDARTGATRWTRNAEGRISGGAVVIGDLVFYSTLKKTTTAVGARTGRFVWRTQRGAFNPVISDGKRLFIVGYSSLFSLRPRKG